MLTFTARVMTVARLCFRGPIFVAIAIAALPLATAHTQSTTRLDSVELRAFVDSFMTARMGSDRIPGAGFVFVQHGRVVLSRGYGLANVAAQKKVHPDSTIWRIGSISKAFTATAVMQLVDRGAVKLDMPVDSYVRRVAIPRTSSAPVTVRHLLNHTAGFDEIGTGRLASARDSVLPLDRFLTGRLVRIRPPGVTTAYSTYGITLAGQLVEETSKLTFDTFLRRNIFEPLGMRRTFMDVPNALQGNVAVGYELQRDSLVAQGWEWYHTTPASSINASIADMGRFVLAHLSAEGTTSARLFGEATRREMHRQQATMNAELPGFALGFYEDKIGAVRVLEHGGNMAGFSALMVLIPSEIAGFFVVNHFEGSRLRDDLKWLLLERLLPAARQRLAVPTSLPSAETVKPERFAGRYIPMWSCFSCQPIRATSVMTVTANPDGTLQFAGGRWIAVDSLRFVKDVGTGYIAFRPDSTGAIKELSAGGFWVWQKVQ